MCNPASVFAIFVGYFASSNPSPPFPPCMHGCLFEFKMADLYRDRKIKLKSMSSCSSDHKDSKNVWISICPMFGNGVMGQNVKRSLTFALFWSNMTLIKICRVIYQIVRMTPGIPEMNILT